MTALNWQFGIDGSWSDASKWLPHAAPTAADDVTIAAAGAYTVALNGSGAAGSLTLNFASAIFKEAAGASLTVVNDVALKAGAMILKGANSFGSVHQSGGVLQLYNPTALGTATLSLTGGELSGMVSGSIGNNLSMGGSGFTIDAATGTTVDFGGGGWNINGAAHPVIKFGSSTRKGTIVWHSPAAASTADYSIDVAGGVLKGGDNNFDFLFANGVQTNVASGAALDLNGFSITSGYLWGDGSIVNSGGAAALVLKGGGEFAGAISGNIAVEIGQVTVFQGASTYTGGTTIDDGQFLNLQGGGSIVGRVVDNGTLGNFNMSGVLTLGLVTGTGAIVQEGLSTLVLNHANTYSGGTTISAGVISVGNSAALGTGAITVDTGELLSTATVTLANNFTARNSATLAAATGATMTLAGFFLSWDAGSAPLTVTFGDSGRAGTVVIAGSGSFNTTNPIHAVIAHGTAKDGGGLGYLLGNSADVTIAAGATLDMAGRTTYLPTLTCAGLITSASAAQIFTTGASSVSGRITGKLALTVAGDVTTLTGVNTYTGGTTIASGATLQIGDGHAKGSIVGDVDDAGALVVNESGAVTLAGVISGAGTFTQRGTGATTLSGANTYTGDTIIQSGELIAAHANVLGSGDVAMKGAELLGLGSFSLPATQDPANTFSFTGVNTIAAAHGTTLRVGGASIQMNAGTLVFGEGGNDGTVVFKAGGGSVNDTFAIRVKAGTLKAGDAAFGSLTSLASGVTVLAGATLDLGGFSATTPQLLGSGAVTNAGPVVTLQTVSGAFNGAITGAIKLLAGDVTLTGTNTYTGGTLIFTSYTLRLGDGGASGSIVGDVEDRGALLVNETGAVSLAGVISGAGAFVQAGAGTTKLSGVNSYTGGTTIQKGVLVSANGKALGVGGTITLTGGELLAAKSQTLTHDLHTGGSVTIAAAHGTTLTLATASDDIDAGKIVFGDGANDGTVVFEASGGLSITDTPHTSVEVRAGTLKPGDGSLSSLLQAIRGTKIDAGAAIDTAGHSFSITALTGAGAMENTGAAAVLTLRGNTNFGGVISGKFSKLDIFDNAALSGNETFTGLAEIEGGTLTLSGLFGENVAFNGGGTLVLTSPPRFTGTIQGFATGAAIDLENINGAAASLSYNATSHVLRVSDGTHTDGLTFAGAYTLGDFAVSADGSGGALITWQAAPPAPAASQAPAAATSSAPVHRFVSAMAGFGAPRAALSHPPIHAQAVANMVHLAARL